MKAKFVLVALLMISARSQANDISVHEFSSGLSIQVDIPDEVTLGSNILVLASINNLSSEVATYELGIGCVAASYSGATIGAIRNTLVTNTIQSGATNHVSLNVMSNDYMEWAGLTQTLRVGLVIHVTSSSEYWTHNNDIYLVHSDGDDLLIISTNAVTQGSIVSCSINFSNPYSLNISNLIFRLIGREGFAINGSFVEYVQTYTNIAPLGDVVFTTNFIAHKAGTGLISVTASADQIYAISREEEVLILDAE